MKEFKRGYGIMPAAMTIWNEDQTYNKVGMEKYLRWLMDNGAHSISVCGSTGENIAMTMEEQKAIIAHTCSFIDGEVPVYYGTGRYATMQTIELSKHAQDCGADGCLVILPYYLLPYKRAVMNHYRELREHIDINIMLYNNPWFTGIPELSPLDVKELLDEGVINSIKAAHGDANRVHELKFHCGDKLTVLYGHDYAPMEGLLAKADGWLSAFPAIFPRQCRNLFDICTIEKDVDKANAYQYKMQPFTDYFMYDKKNAEPHFEEICKYALKVQGLDFAGLPRRPLGELDDANKKKVEKLLADLL